MATQRAKYTVLILVLLVVAGGLIWYTLLDRPRPSADRAAEVLEGPFSPWGWPLPYEQVKPESIEWLRQQGWWPLTLGSFADVPGYSTHFSVMKELGLLERRGIQAEYVSFLTGPPIVEAFISGQTQVTHYGDFPFWSTVDKGNPALAFALTGVNNEAALLVRPDSTIEDLQDVKESERPLVVGTTLGSYAEFYVTAMALVKGLEMGTHYQLAGMSGREAQLVPKGTDAVAIWDPHITFSINKGLSRRIDTVFPYYFPTGYEFVRREIHENAPDVVQAIADAVVEATLYVRYNPEQARNWYRSDPRIQAYPEELIEDQVSKYFLLYKPTYKYLHADFWATEDERVVNSQFENGRLSKRYSAEDLKKSFAPQYLERTFDKLGFRVPEQPVFLPEDWTGSVGDPPYPPYWNVTTMSEPMRFPEEGDLTKDWSFADHEYEAPD